MPKLTDINDIFLRVKCGSSDECWPWMMYTNRGGYGVVMFRGSPTMAHRVIFEAANGPIPKGLYILHKCDNRICCNPNHLFMGTIADNNADKMAKGRHRGPRGTGHPLSKITEADVISIREKYKNGHTQVMLAREFGVHQTKISEIVRGLAWKHVG